MKNYLMFPHALPLLRSLTGTLGDPQGPRRTLQLRYRDGQDGQGWLTVEEAATEPAS